MPPGIPRTDFVRNVLKARLKASGVTYPDLERRLASLGISRTTNNIGGKLGHGRFSAEFLLQCMVAIGADRPELPSRVTEPMRRRRRWTAGGTAGEDASDERSFGTGLKLQEI